MALAAPTASDAVHFDNTDECDLSVNAFAASAYFDTSSPTVKLQGHTWTVSGGNFSFGYGSIYFDGSGGHLILSNIPAGTWTGAASFLYDANGAEVTIQSSSLLSITDDTAKTCNPLLHITGSGSELRWTASGGATIGFGATGSMTLDSSGKVSVFTAGNKTSQSAVTTDLLHTNSGSILINSGTFQVYGDNGGPNGASTLFTSDLPIQLTGGTLADKVGTLDVHNKYNSLASSVTNTGGNIDVWAGDQLLWAHDGGFYQTSGNTNINPTGVGGTAHTQGDWDFFGGSIKFNSTVFTIWNLGSYDLLLESGSHLYMTAGKNQTGDSITNVGTTTLGGVIHLAVTGTWAQNNTTKLIDDITAISGSFGTRYYGWTGTANLDTYFSLSNTGADLVATHL